MPELLPEVLNQGFIDSQSKYNEVIAARAKRYNKLWGKLITRGTFKYGEGYTKNKFMFHSGTVDQTASRLWQAMQESSAPNPSTGDPGHDACRYQASIVDHGIEQRQFTVYETLRRSKDLCLTDYLFKWQGRQIIKQMMIMFADITLGEWETFERDSYLEFCQKIYAIPGLPEFATAMGADTITMGDIDVNDIGLLSQETLDRLYQYLYREAATGALTMLDGMPAFGVMTSAESSTDIIEQDSTRRTDMRYADPQFLLKGIGHVKRYKSWVHMIDPQGIRYKLNAGGTALVRVWPNTTLATTIGMKTKIDEEYIDAPFEISFVMVKDVYKVQVPPPNPSSEGSATFDPIANFGDFRWINIPDRVTNPYREIGFWMGRYRAAPEPLDNADRCFAILHRRNVGMTITLPAVCDTDPQSDAVNVESVAQVGNDTLYDRVQVVLAECLNCTLGGTVTVTNGASATAVARITSYQQGTTYELTFASDADWVTWVNTGVSTPTVTCI